MVAPTLGSSSTTRTCCLAATADLRPPSSGKIEQQNLRGRSSCDGEARFVLDGGTVAFLQLGAVQCDRAPSDLKPGASAGGEIIGYLCPCIEPGHMHSRVLLDRDRRAGPPRPRREFEHAAPALPAQRLLFIAGRDPSLARDHPDLKEVDGLIGRGVVFAMGNPGAGAHPL